MNGKPIQRIPSHQSSYSSSMPAHLTGRTVRVLIGTEPKNLVTRDVSEVKVTWEGFTGDTTRASRGRRTCV